VGLLKPYRLLANAPAYCKAASNAQGGPLRPRGSSVHASCRIDSERPAFDRWRHYVEHVIS
jgi:hypothetical protein